MKGSKMGLMLFEGQLAIVVGVLSVFNERGWAFQMHDGWVPPVAANDSDSEDKISESETVDL